MPKKRSAAEVPAEAGTEETRQFMHRVRRVTRRKFTPEEDLHEKKLNLDDDFIKFVRFGQWRIGRTGAGILGFITNNTYTDGITHRRMR